MPIFAAGAIFHLCWAESVCCAVLLIFYLPTCCWYSLLLSCCFLLSAAKRIAVYSCFVMYLAISRLYLLLNLRFLLHSPFSIISIIYYFNWKKKGKFPICNSTAHRLAKIALIKNSDNYCDVCIKLCNNLIKQSGLGCWKNNLLNFENYKFNFTKMWNYAIKYIVNCKIKFNLYKIEGCRKSSFYDFLVNFLSYLHCCYYYSTPHLKIVGSDNCFR